MKKVAIIAPIYNVKPYLSECIESVLKQDYTNFTLILVDDESSDGSQEVAKNFAKIDDKIILLCKKNGGQASARNAAIDFLKNDFKFKQNEDDLNAFEVEENELNLKEIYSKNVNFGKIDYILFLDSDDFLALNCLSVCVEKMQNCDVLWFKHDYKIELAFKKASLNQMQIYGYENECEITSKQWLENIKNSEKSLPVFWFAWQGMINFEYLKKINLSFINGITYEDTLYGILLFSRAKSIYILPQKLYFYRLRGGSTMNKTNKKIEKNFHLYKLFLAFNENINLFRRYQDAINWLTMTLELVDFLQNTNEKNKALIEEIFLPIYLDNCTLILYFQNDPLNLQNKLKSLMPFYEKYAISGSQSIIQGAKFRVGQIVINNFRSFSGLCSLPKKIKEELKQSALDKQIYDKNLANFNFICFQNANNKDLIRAKNYKSYKLGARILKILKILKIKF